MKAAIMVLIFLATFLFIGVVIEFFKYLWNSTITNIFGVRKITFWESFRLMLITTILFGGCQLIIIFFLYTSR